MPHAITATTDPITTAELDALARNPDREIRAFASEVLRERQASRAPQQRPDPRITALAFAEIPAVGTAPIWRGQTYALVGAAPHVDKSGESSQVLCWRSRCWDCGEPFEFNLPLGGSRWLRRRCVAHAKPGQPVQVRQAA